MESRVARRWRVELPGDGESSCQAMERYIQINIHMQTYKLKKLSILPKIADIKAGCI